MLSVCAACPTNCAGCVVDDNSDTTARCTECNDYHRLIDATVSSNAVAGNCYRMCSFIVDLHVCISTMTYNVLRETLDHGYDNRTRLQANIEQAK